MYGISLVAVGGKRTSARVNIVPCSGTKKRGTECLDRKSGSAGMPRPISYAVFCLKKKSAQLASVSWPIAIIADPANHRHAYLCSYLGPNINIFFFNDTVTTEIYNLSLHDALPI